MTRPAVLHFSDVYLGCVYIGYSAIMEKKQIRFHHEGAKKFLSGLVILWIPVLGRSEL